MKYKLRQDLRITTETTMLYRIERLSDGKLGGYIEKEANLSQGDDSSWVSGNAWVYGDARVFGNAWVSDDARVSGNAWVFGNARVCGNAVIPSSRDIMNVIFNAAFSITITPQNIVVGCQLFTREACLKISKKEAIAMGLPSNMYSKYKDIIKACLAMVPTAKKVRKK